MNKGLEKQLAAVFEQAYPGCDFFVEHVINRIFTGDDAYEALPVPEDYLTDENRQRAYESGILRVDKVGTIDTEEPIEVFDITLSDRKELQYNRVGIQQFIRSQLFPFTNAFMLFHNEDPAGKDWRFSFAYKQLTQASTTSAKRFTYLFGRDHRAKTASERFAWLADRKKSTQDLLEAFSVQKVSEEFFDEYRRHYAEFCDYLFAHRSDPGCFGAPFATWEDKLLRDYVKKMMGRITFIYFLQRKGWMNGDQEYMQHSFATSCHQDDYLDKFLEPLFFGVLNTRPGQREQLFIAEGWDTSLLQEWQNVPYLNGGLFERDVQDEPRSRFPAEMFKRLFDFYAGYNFTIDENDPDDAEVGVDPEMLGKIFESLLEDNKDKGAFYTPKEIVDYMCQESLIAYLQTDVTDEDTREALRRFVADNDGSALRAAAPLPSARTLGDTCYQRDARRGGVGPLSEHIDKLLRDVKICDPAIGSGAFPMGLLNLLVRCRETIGSDKRRVELKREIIQNNIYGVDIEKGAIDIARLRFWLSLIVDEETPQALPNLDFKIMQGNSLLEQYEDIDLSKLSDAGWNMKVVQPQADLFGHIDDPQLKMTFSSETHTLDLQRNIARYFSIEDHEEKARLFREIEEDVRQNILYNIDLRQGQAIRILKELELYPSLNRKQAKEKEIKTAAVKRYDELMEEVRTMAFPNDKFFLWHSYFKDVFDKGGFDIVIGNPPYKILTKNNTNEQLLSQYLEYFESLKKANSKNLYTLFIEKGVVNISKSSKAVVSFIIPEGFFKTRSYQECVDVMKRYGSTKKIVTFSDYVFENAVTGSLIFVYVKGEKNSPIDAYAYKGNGIFELYENEDDSLLNKIANGAKPLSELAVLFKGMVIKDREVVLHNDKNELPDSFILGKNISKWNVDSYFYTDYSQLEIIGGTKKYEKHQTFPRIVIRRTGSELCCAMLKCPCITESTLYSCYSKDNTVEINFLYGLLNSRLLNYYNQRKNITNQQGFPQILMTDLQEIPIKIGSKMLMDSISEVASNISSSGVDEKGLDLLVYHLYGLTYDEVLIVDPDTPIMREEYGQEQ